jgi:hypothetical protein
MEDAGVSSSVAFKSPSWSLFAACYCSCRICMFLFGSRSELFRRPAAESRRSALISSGKAAMQCRSFGLTLQNGPFPWLRELPPQGPALKLIAVGRSRCSRTSARTSALCSPLRIRPLCQSDSHGCNARSSACSNSRAFCVRPEKGLGTAALQAAK